MMFGFSFEAGMPIFCFHELQNSVGLNPTIQHKPMSFEEELSSECY